MLRKSFIDTIFDAERFSANITMKQSLFAAPLFVAQLLLLLSILQLSLQ